MVIKNQIKIKCKVKSFLPTLENDTYFNKISNTNLSSVINKAIAFYILLLDNPKQIMMELKRRCPATWKRVNRRKF